MQAAILWVQAVFKAMFTCFSAGAVMQFKGYDRPMEFFLARDWYLLGKDIIPAIRQCPELEKKQQMDKE